MNILTKTFAIGAAALALATPALAETMATSTPHATIDTVCMQAAVDKRESSLISAYGTLGTSVTAAFSARKDALKAAWAQTDRKMRRTALRDAWKTWTTSSRAARAAWKTAQEASWSTFVTDRKACGPGAAADDPTTRGAEAHL